jgi:hypothetical protein
MNYEHLEYINKKICSMRTCYSDGERRYIVNKITNAIRHINDNCMDNFRFSDDSDEYNRLYDESADRGCCGFYDEEIKLKSGKIFKFGFNYGH